MPSAANQAIGQGNWSGDRYNAMIAPYTVGPMLLSAGRRAGRAPALASGHRSGLGLQVNPSPSSIGGVKAQFFSWRLT